MNAREIARANAGFFTGIIEPFLISSEFTEIILDCLEGKVYCYHHELGDMGQLKVVLSETTKCQPFIEKVRSEAFKKVPYSVSFYGNFNEEWLIYGRSYELHLRIETYKEKVPSHSGEGFRVIDVKNLEARLAEETELHRTVQVMISKI